jgi:hypothetical protein
MDAQKIAIVGAVVLAVVGLSAIAFALFSSGNVEGAGASAAAAAAALAGAEKLRRDRARADLATIEEDIANDPDVGDEVKKGLAEVDIAVDETSLSDLVKEENERA